MILLAGLCMLGGLSRVAHGQAAPGQTNPVEIFPAVDHQQRFLYTTLEVRGSRAPDDTLLTEVGMDIGRSIMRHAGLGVSIAGGTAPLLGGNRNAVSVMPNVELFHFAGPLELYGRVGAGVQYRSGARLDSARTLGGFTAVGTRLRLGRCHHDRPRDMGRSMGCLLLGMEIRVQKATGDWLMSPAVLPGSATIVSTGFHLGFEL